MPKKLKKINWNYWEEKHQGYVGFYNLFTIRMIKTLRAEQVYEYTSREMYLKNLGLEFQEPKYIFCSDVVITRFLDADPFGNINFNDLTLYVINERDMVDVDTEFDFEMAEMILKKRIKMI